MKIQCPKCKKEYTIADERLKAYRRDISMPCPNCKGTIEIRIRADGSAGGDQSREPTPPTKELDTGQTLKDRILRTLRDLPPMPQVVEKARKILADTDCSFADLARVIETDQGIATRVLKMANSPYYGLSGNVSSVQHATVILGGKTLMELLNLACSSELLSKTLTGYDLEAGDLWSHSLAVATGSQIIAKKVHPALEPDAFAAGLIHDVGKIILDPYVLERKEKFQAFVRDGRQSFLVAEKEILGFDHAELASEVCELWKIPEHIALSIRYHHDPTPSGGNDLAYIVHMADAIAIMSGIGAGIDGMLYHIEGKAFEHLRLSQDDIGEIMADMADYVEKTTREM